jgi:hypothetical protein
MAVLPMGRSGLAAMGDVVRLIFTSLLNASSIIGLISLPLCWRRTINRQATSHNMISYRIWNSFLLALLVMSVSPVSVASELQPEQEFLLRVDIAKGESNTRDGT